MLINESAWEEMTCLFALSLKLSQPCALRLPYRMAGVLFYSPSQ
ncbi:hypothetical protein [Klebsiella pneumoniae]